MICLYVYPAYEFVMNFMGRYFTLLYSFGCTALAIRIHIYRGVLPNSPCIGMNLRRLKIDRVYDYQRIYFQNFSIASLVM